MLTCTQRRSGLQTCWFTAVLAAAALLIPACGDDGDAPPPDAYAGDGVAPTVKVTFPPPSSLTDTPMVTIRGTADDVDDVAAVRVNGVMAQSDDGFATWEATVPLVHGANAITVAAEDEFDAVDETAAELTVVLSANVMDSPTAVVADPANDRALVFDRQLDALVAVSYATGERTIVSDDATGEGPGLQDPAAAALDEANGRVLVLDGASLLAVDLATGDRTVIADAATGAGDALVDPFDVALDVTGNRALVLDLDLTDITTPVSTLYAVALDTGDRTVIARGAEGSGPELLDPTAVAIDPAGNRALVASTDATTDPTNIVRAILAVDLTTFERTVVSTNADDAQGRLLGDPVAMVLDDTATPARLLILDGGLDAVLAVALDTGNRTVVAEDGASPGQDFSVPDALALDKAEGGARALVVDSGLDMVIAVALDDGERAVISGFNVGEGPLFQQPVAVVVDERTGPAGFALVVDRQQDALVSVDLATSGRKEVSGDEAGSGDVTFDDPQALSLDVETGLDGQVETVGKIVVADPGAAALLSVDPVSGARVTLSGGPAGAGPAFGAPRGVAFDPGDAATSVSARFLVVDEELDALLAVDPASGDRTIVSDATTGAGPALGAPQAVTLELGAAGRTGRALVLTEDPAALIAVDLTTGDREELSGPSKGDGSVLEAPLSVLMELRKAPPPAETDPDAGPDASPAFEPTGYALVVHGGAGALLAIELNTGRRTELFANGLGKGPQIDIPRAVWLDAENDRLVIADEGLDALLVVDRESLDRVVVSR